MSAHLKQVQNQRNLTCGTRVKASNLRIFQTSEEFCINLMPSFIVRESKMQGSKRLAKGHMLGNGRVRLLFSSHSYCCL